MRILSRYFLASYLGLFAGILLVSLMAIAIVEMLVNFEDVFGQETGARGALTYLVLRLPAYYARELIPLTSFAAAFFCVGLPARRREITAIRAGGISPLRIAVPVLGAAALLSGAHLIVLETVVLDASRRWDHLGEPQRGIEFRRGSFWYQRGNAIYNVQDADRESRTLQGVAVFEIGPRGRLLRSIRADSVRIEEGDRWHFLGATLWAFDPSAPTRPPSVERVAETVFEVAEQRDLALLSASATTLSVGNLIEYIAARTREGRATLRYRAMLHTRLAEPLAVLLFALLALPLGVSVERTQSFAASAVQGFFLVGLYYGIRGVGAMLASNGFAAAATAPWMLLTALGGYGSWRLARIPS